MITPEYLQKITERIKRIAEDMEDELLIALILALYDGETSETEVYEQFTRIAETYAEYGSVEIHRVFEEAAREMAHQAAVEKLQEIYPDIAPEDAEKAAREVLDDVGGVRPITLPQTEENPQERLVDAEEREQVEEAAEEAKEDFEETAQPAEEETQETWYNLTGTEAYATNEQYVEAVDAAYIDVTENDVPRDEAVDEAVEELEEQGITYVENKRREHLDVAIQRNLRTAVARAAGDATLKRALENGYTLVLVSAHLGARPTHEVWQGKVYSIVGATEKYKDFFKETEYGEMLGLCGINCRHTFYPWKEGMTNPYEDIDPEESRKRYELEQKQREMERRIRALKRKVKALQAKYDATGNGKQELQEAKRELAAARKRYKEFCAENDLRELTERLKIEG